MTFITIALFGFVALGTRNEVEENASLLQTNRVLMSALKDLTELEVGADGCNWQPGRCSDSSSTIENAFWAPNSRSECETECNKYAKKWKTQGCCRWGWYSSPSDGDSCYFSTNSDRTYDRRSFYDRDNEVCNMAKPELSVGIEDVAVAIEEQVSDGSATQWTCQTGQAASGGVIARFLYNSEESCGAACDADSECYAFDYTTRSIASACRHVKQVSHAAARLGSGGGDNRQYCSPGCNWQPGRCSDSSSTIENAFWAPNSRSECETECNKYAKKWKTKGCCKWGWYSSPSEGDSCYFSTDSDRTYNKQSFHDRDNRVCNMAKPELSVGIEDAPVAIEEQVSDGSATRWTCQTGQAASGGAIATLPYNSEESCGAACDGDSECYAFDYTTRSMAAACRHVKQVSHAAARLGNGGGDNRQYCSPGCNWQAGRCSDSSSTIQNAFWAPNSRSECEAECNKYAKKWNTQGCCRWGWQSSPSDGDSCYFSTNSERTYDRRSFYDRDNEVCNMAK